MSRAEFFQALDRFCASGALLARAERASTHTPKENPHE
jgi:hypothetical protein